MAPAASERARIGTGSSRSRSGTSAGSCASAASQHRNVIGGGVGAGVARPQQHRPAARRSRRGSSASGWKPKPPLRCGAAPSFSVCTSSSCASKSSVIVAGRAPSRQARSRAAAPRRADRCPLPAPSAYNSRVAVESDATEPEQVGLIGERTEIGEAVTAVDQHRRQIDQHPARIVRRAAAMQMRKRVREGPRQGRAGRQARSPTPTPNATPTRARRRRREAIRPACDASPAR